MVHSRVLYSFNRLVEAVFDFGPPILKTLNNVLMLMPVAGPVGILFVVLVVIAIAAFAIAWIFRNVIGEVVYEIAKLSEDVIDGIIGVIDRVMKFFHAHPRPDKLYYAEHIEFMKNKHMCDPYDSYGATILHVVRSKTSRHLCPTIRYLYGTPAGVVLMTILTWFSFDPAPEGANCMEPSYAEYCVYFIENWRFWVMAGALMVVLFVVGVSMPIIDHLLLIALRATILCIDIVYYSVREVLFLTSPHLRKDKLPV